ncbi:ribosome biogenesis GTPase Der [Nisaea acidiphila]|uniref:GTPase Der n=1 Tax=Nisaea acidiphila TaxID=1862145 RepID=A0A9J7AS27_9PROT|nr:ribosome biogenesis GTPase Der [Nisaea acidiphila]UUX49361.1 ribosome biogenesis GTPase Der [Nisaea acidiphila]
MSFTVAIIGRPNVGKSTLFNRLVGKRIAIVDDQPGVTRDRREGEGRVGDLSFRLFDTAGLEDAENESLEGRMRLQTEAAVSEADAVLFVIDARAGVTPLDDHFARWLRREKQKVILVANKCEGKAGAPGLYEAFGLGLGDPVPLSAEHGEGLGELYDALNEFAPEEAHDDYAALDAAAEESDDIIDESPDGAETWRDAKAPDTIRLAIVGRPNVGKSTFVNALLGEDRMLTGPEAGITRDAIESDWVFEGQPFKLFDTAGLRRRSKVTQRLEYLSGEDTRRAIQFAHVVVLMLDATTMLEKQDLTIARMVVEEGRALVIAANKWDIVENREKALGHLRDRLQTSLPQVKGIPYITISAERGRNLDKLLKAVVDTYDTWNRRVSTSRLNRWLQDMTAMHPPPLAKGRRIKLRYMTQIKTRPPTFAAFVSQPTELPDAYTRYLVNGLRETFKLTAVPIRFYLRGSKNPYVKDE